MPQVVHAQVDGLVLGRQRLVHLGQGPIERVERDGRSRARQSGLQAFMLRRRQGYVDTRIGRFDALRERGDVAFEGQDPGLFFGLRPCRLLMHLVLRGDLPIEQRQVGVRRKFGLDTLLQLCHPLDEPGDVDVVPAQVLQRVAGHVPRALALVVALRLAQLRVEFGDARTEVGRTRLVQAKLVAVVEAQHPLAAVVDALAVVLFVPGAVALDLAQARDGARRRAEGLHRVDALEVEVNLEFFAQPLRQPAGCDFELAHQRVRARGSCARLLRPHAAVEEPLAGVMLFEPGRHCRVMFVLDQQRARKAAQHAFDRALPGRLAGAHLQQLAGKRQALFGQAQLAGHRGAQIEQARRDVGPLALHRAHFAHHAFELALSLLFAALGRVLARLGLAASLLREPHMLARAFHASHEAHHLFGQRPAHRFARLLRQLALAQPLRFGGLGFVALAFEVFDQTATAVRTPALQLGELVELVAGRVCQQARLLPGAGGVGLQRTHAVLLQIQAPAFAKDLHAHRQLGHHILVACGLLALRVRLLRRQQGFDLAARRHHGLMGRVEFAELGHQPLGDVEGLRRVEHEVAQEGVEIAHVLGRLGLVQQTQGALAVDAQQRTKALLVGAELIGDEGLRQIVLEAAAVEIAAGEELQRAQIELVLQHQVHALDLRQRGGLAANPQQLRQRDRSAFAVAVGFGQRRPSGIRAQELGQDLAAFAAVLRPGAAQVAHHVAIVGPALAFARGDVEGHPLGRRHQRGVRVQQRRLARSRGPDEQVACGRDREVEEAAEGAPVEGLQPGQAKLMGLAAGRRGFVVEQRAHAGSSSSRSLSWLAAATSSPACARAISD